MSTIHGLIEALERRIHDTEHRVTVLETRLQQTEDGIVMVMMNVMSAAMMLTRALEDPKRTNEFTAAARGCLQAIIDAGQAVVTTEAPTPVPPTPDTSAWPPGHVPSIG